jgi:putative ribosome biogenesis GTPase RsgA
MIAKEVQTARVIFVTAKEDLTDDLKRQWNVAVDEGTAKAAEYGVPFVLTSARTRNGIESLTVIIGDAVLEVAEVTAIPEVAIANIGGAGMKDKKCC